MKKPILFTLSVLSLFGSGCHAGARNKAVRPAAVAGQFYPSDPAELRLAITRFLEQAARPSGDKPLALVVPHAGYIYCGQIIADAFRQTEGNSYDLVVVLGTNHTTPGFSGVSVWAEGAFQTPLGMAAVDEEAATQLLSLDKEFTFDARVHEREHSVEVQIPFIQHLFPKARILPIIVGKPDLGLCARLGHAIAQVARGRSTLIVASTDLSHYPDYEDAQQVDRETLRAMATLSPETVRSATESAMSRRIGRLSTCACGEAPVLAAMFAAKELGAVRVAVVSYANSGDAAVGEYDRVVGYGAVAFTSGTPGTDLAGLAEADTANTEAGGWQPLSATDKQALLAHARMTLEWYMTSGTVPLCRGFGAAARMKAGAFVTLEKHGDLRGCIGHMVADMPLCRTVGGMALAAAFDDRRFQPLTEEELSEVEIEISVLTPAQPVPDASHIVVGRDGVVLRKEGRSAVFLPQVATERRWSREEMLDQLCLKAGLPKGSWKQNAQLSTFRAEVFSEAGH